MKIFFYKLAAIVLSAGLLLVLLNYTVDPANIYSSKKYISGIAGILSAGHNVDNVSNYDERLLQEQMVTRLHQTPDIIVLGSSRIMEVGTDFFPGKTVLNCAVSHADIHDLIAMAGLLDSTGHLPGTIVMNVDPMLIVEGKATEWESLSAYHDSFLRKYGTGVETPTAGLPAISTRVYSLFSFDYFQKALGFLFSGKKKKYTDVGTERPRVYGRFADGTVCYSYDYMSPDTVKVAGDAAATAVKTGLARPDAAKQALLNELLDFFRSKQVKVRLVMLPVHINYYTNINHKEQDLFVNSEAWFRDLAARSGLTITGSFDPRVYGIPESQFYDMYHCNKEAIKKVIL